MERTEVTVTVTVTKLPAIKTSTLECPELTTLRRNGNTSRQVNFAIELLYLGHRVIVEDHYRDGEDLNANNLLLIRILNRITSEYSDLMEIVK
jgi:hypothetical protein